MRNIGFLGRWGTYACPQCLPSDIVPIRSWTWTLQPPGIRHRHLPNHTIPLPPGRSVQWPLEHVVLLAPLRSVQFRTVLVVIYLPSVQFSSVQWNGGQASVPSVHGICYPVLAWSIQLLVYAMPSVPVPPITLT